MDVTAFTDLCCVSTYLFMWCLSLRFYTGTLENSKYFGGVLHSLIFTDFKCLQAVKKESKTENGDEESIPGRREAKGNYSSTRRPSSVTSLNESEVSMQLQI